MENSLSILIFRLNHRLNEKLSPLRNELGLSKGQPKILRYVFHHDGCSQVAIADYYDLSPATVSGLLDGLVRAGLNSALLRGIAYGRLEETLPCRQRLEALGLKVGETFPLEAFFSCHHCGQHPKTE